ncbi:hypothetical protein K474DRAFT_1768145 [Panus rudis PR-1116 ss-1]|nr:hypothetical protein K474DRAFT_1768145 [Panus rudis PR-1116 ss-1]
MSEAAVILLACTDLYQIPPFEDTLSAISVPVKDRAQKGDASAHADSEDEEEIEDRLSSSDAWMFPIIGSVILFGLYIFVKYFGKEWINWLLQWYFAVAGVGSVSKSLISLVRWIIGKPRWKHFDQHRLLYQKGSREITKLTWRTPSLILVPLGALPSILYNFGNGPARRSALLTDILSLSFSHNALSLLKLDSFKTGCVLLSGLFLYDIWWVFGTEVMVKVATNLDVPIKLLWAKSLVLSTEKGFTMLGLGDVVIPGLFVALALRYDHHRAKATSADSSFPKPYFYAALFAYALGLATTMFVMHTFRAAQPALLYLSPACILSFFLTALARGELHEAWSWSDDPELEKHQAGADKEKEKAKDNNTSSKDPRDSHEPASDRNGHANGASGTADDVDENTPLVEGKGKKA